MEYDDKGYVIRCVDKISGKVLYRGSHQKYSHEKDALMPNDTYTISGVKRALANLERMYPDDSFYSIERLSRYNYLKFFHDCSQKVVDTFVPMCYCKFHQESVRVTCFPVYSQSFRLSRCKLHFRSLLKLNKLHLRV